MSWSAQEELEQRKKALRCLFDSSDGEFRISMMFFEQKKSGVPEGVWHDLHAEGFVNGFAPTGAWRLTIDGWIEACRLLKDEIGLDERFGKLAEHLKGLNPDRKLFTEGHVERIAAAIGLSELWVMNAIEGRMAERIYNQHGAKIQMRSIEIPANIGRKLTS
jgi:hypothetical protein